MSKSVKKNFIYNFTFQVILLLIPLLTAPYISRVLGADNIGKYSYATAMATYFTIVATFGSTIYGQRLIAFKRNEKSELSEAFWDIFWFRLFSGTIFLGLYYIYLGIFSQIDLLTIMISLNIVNVIADVTWFYQGIEEFKKTVVRSLVIKIICLVLIFVFVKNDSQTWLYALFFTGSLLIGNIILWIPLHKYISLPKSFHPFKHMKGMFWVFIPAIASQVYTVLDKSMIGWITNSDYANGCYEQSERLARAALTVVTSIGAVVLPRVANLFENKNLETAKNYIYKAYRIVWALGIPIMVGIILVSDLFIPIYLGDGFELSIILLQIFSALVIFVSMSYVTGISYLIPTNQHNVYTISTIIAALLNFVMNLFMINLYGAVGAAISSIVAEGVGLLIQLSYCFISKQLSLKKIFYPALKYIIAAAVMAIVVILLKLIIPSNILGLIVLVVAGAFAYFITLVIERDMIVNNIFGTVKSMLKR